MGGSPGLVVKGVDSKSEGHEFEAWAGWTSVVNFCTDCLKTAK